MIKCFLGSKRIYRSKNSLENHWKLQTIINMFLFWQFKVWVVIPSFFFMLIWNLKNPKKKLFYLISDFGFSKWFFNLNNNCVKNNFCKGFLFKDFFNKEILKIKNIKMILTYTDPHLKTLTNKKLWNFKIFKIQNIFLKSQNFNSPLPHINEV